MPSNPFRPGTFNIPPKSITNNPTFDLNSIARPLIPGPVPVGELPTNWIWVLSGGGAKGSFQVGASLFLSQDVRFFPKAIAATSVGAINALALGESSQAGFDQLKNQWLSLKNVDGMYTFEETLEEIDSLETFRNYRLSVRTFLLDGDFPNVQDIFSRFNIGGLLNAIDAIILLIINQLTFGFYLTFFSFFLFSDIEAVVDKLKKAVEDIKSFGDKLSETKGIWNFTPLETLLRNSVRYSNIRVPLRLVTVSLNDRNVYAVDEQGQLLRLMNDSDGKYISRVIGTLTVREAEALIEGALASSSIPFFNTPRALSYRDPSGIGTSTSNFCDGGVRETFPLGAGLSLINEQFSDTRGEKGLIVISTGAISPRAEDALYEGLQPIVLSDDKVNLYSIVTWGVDVALDEVAASELYAARYSLPEDIEVLDIVPSVSIGSTANLDPGLIQINSSYGYMTAFDRVKQRHDNISPEIYRNGLWRLTNDIIQLRYVIWKLECEGKALRWEYPELTILRPDIPQAWLFKRGVTEQIREVKRSLIRLVSARVRTNGLNSIPGLHDLSHFGVSNENSIVDCWRNWERHAIKPALPYRSESETVSYYRERAPSGPGLIRDTDHSLVDFGRFGSPWDAQWEYEIVDLPPDYKDTLDSITASVSAAPSTLSDHFIYNDRVISYLEALMDKAFLDRYGFSALFIKIYPVAATDPPAITALERSPDYALVRLEGYVFDPARPAPRGTVPLKHYWNPAETDNWTTTKDVPPGLEGGGIVGYVYSPDAPQATNPTRTIPLYTWSSSERRDHMTTSDYRFILGNPFAGGTPVEFIEPDYGSPELEGYLFEPFKEPPARTVPVYSWVSFSRKDYAILPDPVWRTPYKP